MQWGYPERTTSDVGAARSRSLRSRAARSRAQRSQRGAVLVLFALLLVGFFAVAAWSLDLGLAKLSQGSMQLAADLGAVEGLRWRDDPVFADFERGRGGRPDIPPGLLIAPGRLGSGPPQEPPGQFIVTPRRSPDLIDQDRRRFVRDLIRRYFDDNLDPTDGDPLQYGAGPVVELTGGVTSMNALQQIDVPAESAYKPVLQINAVGNLPHGDMVSGTFVSGQAGLETSTYQRDDFAAAPIASSPGASSFLVRLRRTRDAQGLDAVPDVSSTGPTLQLLLARGTAIHGGDPGAGYSPRHHGLDVRATAIADARPVWSVGRANQGLGLFGAARFALRAEYWLQIAPGSAVTLRFDSGTGQLVDQDLVAGRFTDGSPVALGDGIASFATPAPLAGQLFDAQRYVPIFEDVEGVERVIGFGQVISAASLLEGDGTVLELNMLKIESLVANENASASLPRRAAVPSEPSWVAVIGVSRARTSEASFASLLAPSLVR